MSDITETTHCGLPIIIICPKHEPESIPLCSVSVRTYNPLAQESKPLFLAFFMDSREVRVLTWVGDGYFRTRELTGLEMVRFNNAYENGECMIEIDGIRKPLLTKRM